VNPVSQRPMEILLADGDPAIAKLAKDALQQGDIPANVSHVRDGVRALAFLRREGAYRGAPRPDLLLLDPDLPRIDARELLAQIRRDLPLCPTPVIVLTGATNDYLAALGIDVPSRCILARPPDPVEFATLVRAVVADAGDYDAPSTQESIDRTRLVSDVAHELRTHLNPIIAFSEMMQLEARGSLSSDYREYARGIHQSALALSEILFNLLDQAAATRRPPRISCSSGGLLTHSRASVEHLKSEE
jgi:two-component system, chemotaxis family, response regulator Rcp1